MSVGSRIKISQLMIGQNLNNHLTEIKIRNILKINITVYNNKAKNANN